MQQPEPIQKIGYSYHLVNIDCLPDSSHFNVLMDLAEPIGELLPYLAATLDGCTYVHGADVINYMESGHIVGIYPDRLTITDVTGLDQADELCARYFAAVADVRSRMKEIEPVYEKRPALTVMDILKQLPRTNCGDCGKPTCMAFAAAVFRREATLSACPPLS